jgi:type IV secretion system protein VirB10
MRGLILLALLTMQSQGPRDLQIADGVKPKILVVDKGTVIPIELTNKISTKNIKEGDRIYARTYVPITVGNTIVIPVGTNVQGRIKDAQRPGKVKGKASLTLNFERMILPNGVTMEIYGLLGGSDEGHREGEATIKGDSTKGKDAGDVAKAGGVGGVLGGVFGGGKGAAIGGGASAGVALAGVLLGRGADLELPKGTSLEVVLDQPLEF